MGVEGDRLYSANAPKKGIIDTQRQFLETFSNISGKIFKVFWRDGQEFLERQPNGAFGAFPVRPISFATEMSRLRRRMTLDIAV